MEKENKHYHLIESIVKEHKKYPGLEAYLDDIIDDVYSHSEVIMNTVTNENVIRAYLEKVVSTSIITVPKKQGNTASQINTPSQNVSRPTEHEELKKVDKTLVDKMINGAPIREHSETINKTVQNEIKDNIKSAQDDIIEEKFDEEVNIEEITEENIEFSESDEDILTETFAEPAEISDLNPEYNEEPLNAVEEVEFNLQPEENNQEIEISESPEAPAETDLLEPTPEESPVETTETSLVEPDETAVDLTVESDDNRIDLGSFSEPESGGIGELSFEEDISAEEESLNAVEEVEFNLQPEENNQEIEISESPEAPAETDLLEPTPEESPVETTETSLVEPDETAVDLTVESDDNRIDLGSFSEPESGEIGELSFEEDILAEEEPLNAVEEVALNLQPEENNQEIEISESPEAPAETDLLEPAAEENLIDLEGFTETSDNTPELNSEEDMAGIDTTSLAADDSVDFEASIPDLTSEESENILSDSSDLPEENLQAGDTELEPAVNLDEENSLSEDEESGFDDFEQETEFDLNTDLTDEINGDLDNHFLEESDLLLSDDEDNSGDLLSEDDNSLDLLEESENDSLADEPSEEHKETSVSYSIFNYSPDINSIDESIDIDLIVKDLETLNDKNPDLNILKVYNLKYKENQSVLKIASELEMSENKVIEALNEIIAVV